MGGSDADFDHLLEARPAPGGRQDGRRLQVHGVALHAVLWPCMHRRVLMDEMEGGQGLKQGHSCPVCLEAPCRRDSSPQRPAPRRRGARAGDGRGVAGRRRGRLALHQPGAPRHGCGSPRRGPAYSCSAASRQLACAGIAKARSFFLRAFTALLVGSSRAAAMGAGTPHSSPAAPFFNLACAGGGPNAARGSSRHVQGPPRCGRHAARRPR